ncbi:MAG: hypothetical protein QMC82_09315 [Methanolinea sp.]|nr:hypothetical protein [Methanolinea sp.]
MGVQILSRVFFRGGQAGCDACIGVAPAVTASSTSANFLAISTWLYFMISSPIP